MEEGEGGDEGRSKRGRVDGWEGKLREGVSAGRFEARMRPVSPTDSPTDLSFRDLVKGDHTHAVARNRLHLAVDLQVDRGRVGGVAVCCDTDRGGHV